MYARHTEVYVEDHLEMSAAQSDLVANRGVLFQEGMTVSKNELKKLAREDCWMPKGTVDDLDSLRIALNRQAMSTSEDSVGSILEEQISCNDLMEDLNKALYYGNKTLHFKTDNPTVFKHEYLLLSGFNYGIAKFLPYNALTDYNCEPFPNRPYFQHLSAQRSASMYCLDQLGLDELVNGPTDFSAQLLVKSLMLKAHASSFEKNKKSTPVLKSYKKVLNDINALVNPAIEDAYYRLQLKKKIPEKSAKGFYKDAQLAIWFTRLFEPFCIDYTDSFLLERGLSAQFVESYRDFVSVIKNYQHEKAKSSSSSEKSLVMGVVADRFETDRAMPVNNSKGIPEKIAEKSRSPPREKRGKLMLIKPGPGSKLSKSDPESMRDMAETYRLTLTPTCQKGLLGLILSNFFILLLKHRESIAFLKMAAKNHV